MKRNALTELSSISIEGGALSTSVLHDLMARKPEGATATSYHLEEGYTIGERVAEDWNRVRASWKNIQKERERLGAEPGAGVTRDKFLLPLFERLGYGRLAYSGGLEAGGERYSITHQWGDVPIHLVGMDTDLDSRTAGRAGAASRSPHGLVLEYLNRGEANPWGFVSNGKRLRLLRENRSIVRQSYIEFDLEGILEGESYADFTALWLLCHQSRLEGKGEAHILERWRSLGIKAGERALDELRVGMERTISSLGTGLIAHPANSALREALRKGVAQGGLDTEAFYHELLRLAYRLIFLFVAEDREVLLDPKAPVEAKKRYAEHYSTKRLRDLARSIRGGGHGDLWRGLVILMDLLADSGCPDLALPALGSFLWERESIAHLASCELANRDFLGALRDLAFTRRNEALWPTDFRNLGSEELGSVYESLLELHTELNLEGGSFKLATAAGHERKTSGSYYTPTSLVERLLDEALDPVVARAAKEKNPEAAILALRVCDPAMGSGHFLAGAARRLAKALASVRTGDPEPGPEPLRHAMADVVQNCIYGVDLNPLAVELCKISLWMEALEPGRPLSFLDHHLKCGNSLVGATRELMQKGIPEGAFIELTGDDKATVRAAKRRNAEELGGAKGLFDEAEELFPDYGKIAERFSHLSELEESSLEGVRLLASRYRSIVEAPEYQAELSAANAWCSAFFQPKRPGAPEPITQGRFSTWLRDPTKVAKPLRDMAEELASQASFFHWELAFPEVFKPAGGKARGFDVVVGNPPWDQVQLDPGEYFSMKYPAITAAPNMAAKERLIEKLKIDVPALYAEYVRDLNSIEALQSFVHGSGRFPLTSYGRLNLAPLFAELVRALVSTAGRIGIVVPSGIATDSFNQFFFQDLVKKRNIVSLYDFENREGLFMGVDSRMKFCLLTLSGNDLGKTWKSRFVFFAHSVDDIEDEARRIDLSEDDFKKINPNTMTCPIFRMRRDAELTKEIYSRIPVFENETENSMEDSWKAKTSIVFMTNTDSKIFRNRIELETKGYKLLGNYFAKDSDEWYPLYEAKMTYFYDHRYADVIKNEKNADRQQQPRYINEGEKANPDREAMPYYWVPSAEVKARLSGKWSQKWILVWRSITSTTNERTMVCSIVPISATADKIPAIFPGLSHIG
ncbi:MAG: N-6 DNA methylase, partial [Spirochaetota bacterium]